MNDKKHLWCFQGGDAPIFIKRKNGNTEELTDPLNRKHYNIQDGNCWLVEVEEGDQVFTLTDGFECPTADKKDAILQAVESGRNGILNSFLNDAKKYNWKYQDLTTEIDKVLKQFNYSFSDEVKKKLKENFNNDKVFPVTVTKGKKFKQTSDDLCKTISETNGSISDVINALKQKLVRFGLNEVKGNGDFSKYVDDCAAMGFTVP